MRNPDECCYVYSAETAARLVSSQRAGLQRAGERECLDELTPLMENAFNRRRAPLVARLKIWADGRPLRYARAEMLRYHRAEPRFALETGIHAFDCLRFLMGEAAHAATHAGAG